MENSPQYLFLASGVNNGEGFWIVGIKNCDENILEDENISKIDLARALIESNDIKKAKELLMKAAETGTEAEMHEAKLLYLQLK